MDKRGRKISSRQENLVMGLVRRNRFTDTRIARRADVSKMYVTKVRMSMKLPKFPFSSLPPSKIFAILRLHMNEALSANAIGKKLGIPHDTVGRVIAYKLANPDWMAPKKKV